MSDYIKREDVVEKLVRTFLLQAPTARAIVENIPAADVVERKTAKWKDDYDGGWSTCSECNESFLWEDNSGVAAWNYCPSCGAKVIKEDIPMEYFESGGK